MYGLLHAKDGLGVFPTIALLLFFASFLMIVHFAWKMGQEEVRHCQNLPLEPQTKELP